MERRQLLSRAIAAIHAVIGGTVAVVVGGSALAPGLARRRPRWLPAGALSLLPDNEPTPVTVRVERDDGYAVVVERQSLFLVKTAPTTVVALSSRCTHLGCRVSWTAAEQELRCPCHGGVFERSGGVKAGPPRAPLAQLAVRLDGDRILVQV